MKEKASELLGEPVLAGCLVSPRGFTRKVVRNQVVGQTGALGAVASAVAGGDSQTIALPGGYYAPAYLAVGAAKVAFLTIKQGFLGNALDRVLVEHTKSEVKALEIDRGLLLKEVVLTLHDGRRYLLECGRVYLGDLKKVKRALE